MALAWSIFKQSFRRDSDDDDDEEKDEQHNEVLPMVDSDDEDDEETEEHHTVGQRINSEQFESLKSSFDNDRAIRRWG